MYEFDWSSIVPSLPYLLDGLVITLKITVTAVVIGIFVGHDAGGDAFIQLCARGVVCQSLR